LTKCFSYKPFFFLLLLLVFSVVQATAQTDTTRQKDSAVVIIDTVEGTIAIDSAVKVHSPRTAAIRSAIIPGWGQVYNKKYWKVPIVYGALGTTAGVFVYNVKWYNRFRYAYRVVYAKDSANFANVHPLLRAYVEYNDLNGLRATRDEFRRNIDLSVLVFILFWGLNVVDASVDAHLKSFDVSPDLSLHFKQGYSDLAQTQGFSIILKFK
jgi:hypothetical protein